MVATPAGTPVSEEDRRINEEFPQALPPPPAVPQKVQVLFPPFLPSRTVIGFLLP